MKVIFWGTVANVAILRAYGLKKYHNVDAMVISPRVIDAVETEYIYFKDNPFNVRFLELPNPRQHPLRWYRDLTPADVFHYIGGPRLIYALWFRASGHKVISEFVGSDLREVPFFQKFYRSVFVNKVVTGGPDLLQYIPRKNNVFFLPIPIDPRFFQKNSSEEEYTIFSPTRFEERTKNNRFIFDAWNILKQLNRDAILKVIKWGEDFPRYYGAFSQDKRIKWLPPLSREEMIREIGRSCVIWEQQSPLGVSGLTALEGMASSKPVFSRFHKKYALNGSVPPVISCSTPKEQAERTCRLLEDSEERHKIGRISHKWVEKKHGLEVLSKELYKIYTS